MGAAPQAAPVKQRGMNMGAAPQAAPIILSARLISGR